MDLLVVPLHYEVQDEASGSPSRDESPSRRQRFLGTAWNYFRNLLPILKWFPSYEWTDVIPDAVAGFTVGLTAIAQSISYAGIAGLAPEFGLYSSFISCFIYIFLGSCRQMTIGPTAVVELLTFETCGQDYAPCVILTGFYVGVIQLAMGFLRLGSIVSLISEPVTIGFISGAALTISSSQIQNLFGLKGPKGNDFLGYWKSIVGNISSMQIGDTVMGFISVFVLFILKNLKDWITPRERPSGREYFSRTLWFLSISRNALILIVTTMIAFSWGDSPPFELTGKVASGFPPVTIPQFELSVRPTTPNGTSPYTLTFLETLTKLGTGPISIAFISVLQNVAIAKAFGSGQSIDANQEMITLGLSHVSSSFFSAIPTSGSFSRSAINEASGVRSPIGGGFTGLLVIFALGFLTRSFYYIPKASLAAVVLSAVLPMIEYKSLIPMWNVSKIDILAAVVTFGSSLFLGMVDGMLIGVGTSLGCYILRLLQPQIHSRWIIYEEICKDCLIIKLDQGLAFPSVDYLRTYMNRSILQNPQCRFLVLDCTNMISLDYTAATALTSLAKGFEKKGIGLVFLNCKVDWADVLKAVGLIEPICLNGIDTLNQYLRSTRNEEEDKLLDEVRGPSSHYSEAHSSRT